MICGGAALYHTGRPSLKSRGKGTTVADFHRGFQDVDAQFRPSDQFFKFLDLADGLPSIAKYRERMLELCPTGNGSTVLDVGCGPGSETTRIARRVGKTGMVYGIDASEAIIAEARRRKPEVRPAPLQFQVCDAHGLTFKDASFDLCRAEKVFLYLENPATAIAEMARVTRPGGRVIVFDFDYGARFIDFGFLPDDPTHRGFACKRSQKSCR